MATMIMGRDINGFVTYDLQFPDISDSYAMLLSVGVAQSVTVPSRYKKYTAVFSYSPGSEVWVAKNTTASIPAGAVALNASVPNPVARDVNAGDVISFITPDSTARAAVTFLEKQ